MSPTPGTDRAQSGLGRLGLFLLAVFVLLLVTPTVLGFAGIDVRESSEEADPDEGPILTVLGVEGVAVDEERESIGAIRVTVTNAGSEKIDPRNISATLVYNGTYNLAAAGADATADGTLVVESTDDDGDDGLQSHSDRAVLVVDLGTDDVGEAREVGERLRAGDSATLAVVTAGSESVRVVLSPPGTLPVDGTVAL